MPDPTLALMYALSTIPSTFAESNILDPDIAAGAPAESVTLRPPPAVEDSLDPPRLIVLPLRYKSFHFLVGEPRSKALSAIGMRSVSPTSSQTGAPAKKRKTSLPE